MGTAELYLPGDVKAGGHGGTYQVGLEVSDFLDSHWGYFWGAN